MHDDATTLEVSTYICSLDRRARKAGVQFRMGEDFEEYLSITSKIAVRNFRPDCSQFEPGQAFWVVGEDRFGKVAHVQAFVWMIWRLPTWLTILSH